MKKTVALLPFIVLQSFLVAQQIWHVKSDASGANTGLTWESAFTDLQSALQVAHASDDIWVAGGTYRPTETTDRTLSFVIPTGVRLAGGFAGTETLFGQRDWENNLTILSGDIGVPDISTDNTHHVVSIYGGDSLTVLDGFKITGGRADMVVTLTPQPFGGGVLVYADGLAPISVPIIQNCTFEQNYAFFGGGIGCWGYLSEHIASPLIKNCTFLSNYSPSQGAGVYKEGSCPAAHPFRVEDCIFSDNYSNQNGGGLAVRFAQGEVYLINSVFTADSALQSGGAVYLRTSLDIRYIIDSCSFSNNYVKQEGGAFSHRHDVGNPVIVVNNSSFVSNTSVGGRGGAISCSLGGFMNHIDLSITGCRLENNVGAAVDFNTFHTSSNIRIDRSYFLGNTIFDIPNVTLPQGAGFHYYSNTNNTQTRNRNVITNSVFAFNEGAIAAGSTVITTDFLSQSETTVANCTFFANGPAPFYKLWLPQFDSTHYFNIKILNSVIWEEASEAEHLFNNYSSITSPTPSLHEYSIAHSLVNLPSCEYAGVDPCSTGMIYETPPQFVSTDPAMPDVSLAPGSPAVNAGNNLVADTLGLLYDFAGHPRIVQGTVDMGAFESDSMVSGISALFEQESFLFQVRPTLLSAGDPLQVSLLNLTGKKSFFLQVLSVDGLEKSRSNLENVSGQIPFMKTIPTEQLPTGVYFLLVTDEYGRRKSQKIVLK